ncbi:MAG: zinc ABC transporter substrate-binding protein [Planctomycetota bacterium]
MKHLWLVLLLCVACGSDPKPVDGVHVVATTGMVADLARIIGGERVTVEALMGPGVDPHLYQATPSDVKKLRNAKLVLYNGKGLEGKMADVLIKLARKTHVVAVSEEIDAGVLLKDESEHWDPHVWLDVSLWARCALVVGEALAEVDPVMAGDHRAAAKKFAAQLQDELHPWVKQQVETVPAGRRVLITSHDAFQYFGRAYGVEVRGLQGISTTSVAGVKDVEDMVNLITSRGIKAIFVESSVPPKAIEAVQEGVRAKGGEVTIGGELYSDAMGSEPPTDTYVGMIRHNVETFVKSLQ